VIDVLTRVTMSYEMRASSDWGQSVIQYGGDDTAESCKGTDLRIFRIISALKHATLQSNTAAVLRVGDYNMSAN